MGLGKILAFCVTLVSICIFALQKYYTPLDDRETLVLLKELTESEVVPSYLLISLRLGFLSTVWYTVVTIACDNVGRIVPVNLLNTKTEDRRVKRARFCTFTVWSWLVQGVYYSLVLGLHFVPQYYPSWLIQFTGILFEICISISVLITIIVTFVLVPQSMKKGISVAVFFNWQALLMHNCNVIFMVTELVLNQVQLQMSHLPFACLYGLVYVVFSWVVASQIGYFFYFFLNYNYQHALVAHLLLVSVLGVVFGLTCVISNIFNPEQNLLSVPVLYGFCYLICLVRPPKGSKLD